MSKLVARLFFRFRVLHQEHLIEEGPVIMAMNHQSYFDPPFAGSACKRDIYYLARKNLLEGKFFGWLLPKLNVIPVDQEGGDRSALKALNSQPYCIATAFVTAISVSRRSPMPP